MILDLPSPRAITSRSVSRGTLVGWVRRPTSALTQYLQSDHLWCSGRLSRRLPEGLPVDWTLAIGALCVGTVVGLTGMGGGALMTPMLVLFFGVSPLAAVSSDLVASAVMKPVGSFVHLRHGTVRMDLVKWLCLGSVPAAFCGVLIARALGHGQNVEDFIQYALGVALIIAATGLFLRSYLRLAERAG